MECFQKNFGPPELIYIYVLLYYEMYVFLNSVCFTTVSEVAGYVKLLNQIIHKQIISQNLS